MRRVLQLLVVLAASGAVAAGPVTVVRAARLYDGKSDTVVTPGVVVVSDGRIVGAGTRIDVPAGATVIDLGDATLLPGLMDAHTHLSFESSLDWKQDQLDALKKPIPEQAIDADRVRAPDPAGRLHHRARRRLERPHRRRAPQRHQRRKGPRPADAGGGQCPSAPAAATAIPPAASPRAARRSPGTERGRGQRAGPDPRRGPLRHQARRRRHQDLRHRRRPLRGRQGRLAAAHPGRAGRAGGRGPRPRTEDRGPRPRRRGSEAGDPRRHRLDRARHRSWTTRPSS